MGLTATRMRDRLRAAVGVVRSHPIAAAMRRHPLLTGAGCVAVAALMILAVGLLTAAPPRDWSKSPAALLPGNVGGQQVGVTDGSSGLLDQIKALAPGVGGSAASVAGSPDKVAMTVLVLTGPQNSLNSVQIRIAKALGADRKAQGWEAGPIQGAPDPGVAYQKSESELDGLRVDRVATVDKDGKPVQQWLMIRPSPELLLAVRDLTGSESDARDALRAVLDKAGE